MRVFPLSIRVFSDIIAIALRAQLQVQNYKFKKNEETARKRS
jgi:hypothetical protein